MNYNSISNMVQKAYFLKAVSKFFQFRKSPILFIYRFLEQQKIHLIRNHLFKKRAAFAILNSPQFQLRLHQFHLLQLVQMNHAIKFASHIRLDLLY